MIPRKTPTTHPLLLLVALAAWLPGRAQAGLVFDNSDSPAVTISSSPGGLATRIAVTSSITISAIAVKTQQGGSRDYEFVIFDTANTATPAFLTGPKTFTGVDASFGFKVSDDFSYTLLGGHTY